MQLLLEMATQDCRGVLPFQVPAQVPDNITDI